MTATLTKPSGQGSPDTHGRASTLTGTRALAKLAAGATGSCWSPGSTS